MNIVSYNNAKVTVLFPFEEVAPLGESSSPTLVMRVADRYEFISAPDLSKQTEIAKNGLKFENGSLTVIGKDANIIEFTIFTDGVVITAQTTEQAEIFWNDISAWMINENGFRPFSDMPVRRFVSQLVVEFSKPLDGLVKKFNSLISLVSDQVSSVYDENIVLGFSRLDIGFDKIGYKSSLTVPGFIIERRQGVAFSKERYYCSAPIRTSQHVEILEKIENILL